MTVRYLAVVAVVAVVCLFVEEMTTPLPTMAKLSYIGMNTYIHRDVLMLSLIHISEPTRRHHVSRMPSSA